MTMMNELNSDFVDSEHYEKLIGHTMKCLESSVKSKKTTFIKIVVSSKTQPTEFKKLIVKIFDDPNSQLKYLSYFLTIENLHFFQGLSRPDSRTGLSWKCGYS